MKVKYNFYLIKVHMISRNIFYFSVAIKVKKLDFIYHLWWRIVSTIPDFYILQYYYIQTILNIPKGRKNSLDYTLVILSYFVFYFCHKRASSSWQLLISPLQLPFKLAILLLARSGCWLARGNNSETLTLPLDSYYWNNRVFVLFSK